MRKWILCLVFMAPFSSSFLAKAELSQKAMLSKTKDALMSYEVVEERTDKIIENIEQSVFGEYAQRFAVAMPLVTGKLRFKIENLNVSYSHFDDTADIDYSLGEKWKLFFRKRNGDGNLDEKSGVKYSFNF